MLNIAVDATCWQNQRGYGRHARSLLKALVHLDPINRYTFFLDSVAGVDDLPVSVRVHQVSAGSPAAVAASSDGRRSLLDLWRMSQALSGPGYDILLFPTVYSYVPVLTQAKKIVFIHDVIAEKFPEQTLPDRKLRLFWNAKVTLGRRQADALVTVSTYSRRQIVETFRIPESQIHVVGEASDPIFRRLERPQLTSCLAGLGVPAQGRLIAYVGGFGPHKNMEALVEAFASLSTRPGFADVRLVLVGEYRKEVFHSTFGRLQQKIETQGVAGRVIFTGFLPDEELVVLLNRSTVLALPSLMEGFGLPAVEAAACGCPVVATTASPLPELLGEGGLFIDPACPGALSNALETVLMDDNRRERMRRAGLAAARALTWENAARQLLNVMDRVSTNGDA